MCSIVGFVGRRGAAMDHIEMAKMLAGNEARGPHAFGFAWVDGNGRLHRYKQSGKYSSHAKTIGIAQDARMFIGHLRYATHGDAAENINNHPHSIDGGWLVHNGVVTNHAELVMAERLWGVSDCDTEAIGLLAEQSEADSARARLIEACGKTNGSLAVMALWSRPARMVAVRRGNPLAMVETERGYYLASVPESLPGGKSSDMLADGTVLEFTYGAKGRTIVSDTASIETERHAAPRTLWNANTYRGG